MRKTIALILTSTILLTGCFKDKEVKEETVLIRPVKIIEVNSLVKNQDYFEYPGVIYPSQNTIMAFEVSGTIKKFNFKVGEHVKKGDVVAFLDKRDFISNAKAAKISMKTSLKDLNRAKKLISSGAISQRDYDNAALKYESSKSTYEITLKALEDTSLIAEFSGVMAKKLVNDYARISAKQEILILQDNSKLEIKIDVPEQDIVKSRGELDKLNEILKAEVFITAINNKKFDAKIKELSTTADHVTRTFEGTLVMDNPKEETVLPGMSAMVRITKKAESNKMHINSNLVKSDSNKKFYVWLMNKNDEAIKREVTVGDFYKDSLHIISGLEKNDKIITSGISFLKENMKVKELR